MLVRNILATRLLIPSVLSAQMLAGSLALAADQAPNLTYELPMTRSAHFSDLGKKVNAECNQLYHLLLDPQAIMDPDKRKALLTTVKPLLIQYRSDAHQLAVQDGNSETMAKTADFIDGQTIERLALLGDEESMKQLAADAAGADVDKAMKAQSILLQNRWTLADLDKAKQTEIVDALEKLDRAHTDNEDLANLTLKFAGRTGTVELRDRLLELGADVMTGKAAKQFQTTRTIRAAAVRTQGNIGKEFVLSGTTADGKNFTTADWKGKVILVDFWATWCGPCKAELPEIKKLYADLHDKGFEIVGVSNDFSLAALQKYTAENAMPWPQLLDADAAKKQKWNPMTLGYGIDGIPRIFVINKRGELIDDHASHTYKDVVAKAMAE